MKRGQMKARLKSSLQAETLAVEKRVPTFAERAARADAALEIKIPATKPAVVAAVHAPATVRRRGEPVVRDTYSMPKNEYDRINNFRQQCSQAGRFPNKSQIVRAGLLALSKLDTDNLIAAVTDVESLRPGPKRS